MIGKEKSDLNSMIDKIFYVYEKDPKGKVTCANLPMLRMFGLSAVDEIHNLPIRSFLRSKNPYDHKILQTASQFLSLIPH